MVEQSIFSNERVLDELTQLGERIVSIIASNELMIDEKKTEAQSAQAASGNQDSMHPYATSAPPQPLSSQLTEPENEIILDSAVKPVARALKLLKWVGFLKKFFKFYSSIC